MTGTHITRVISTGYADCLTIEGRLPTGFAEPGEQVSVVRGVVNTQPVAEALGLLGAAYRGDWLDFDGRTLRAQLDELAAALTADEPFDVRRWAASSSICTEARSWAEHCTERPTGGGTDTCAHIVAFYADGLAGEPT
jgi:hypothetical protein